MTSRCLHNAPRPVVLPLAFVLRLMFLLRPSLTPVVHAAGPTILRVKVSGATTATCGSQTNWS